jgi:starch phosphorylase
VKFRLGVAPVSASPRDVWMAVAYMVRDLMVEARFRSSSAGYRDKKWVGYLSMEFLIGRLLVTTLHNLGLVDAVNEALAPLCMTAESLGELEPEAGLGNGVWDGLPACFLDSMATMDIPAIGYGVRYEHGMFRQEIIHGEQVERSRTGCASRVRGRSCNRTSPCGSNSSGRSCPVAAPRAAITRNGSTPDR